METTKITSAALRQMQMGETITFRLPDAAAVDNGRCFAYRLQHRLLCRFNTSANYGENTLTVTKNPRP